MLSAGWGWGDHQECRVWGEWLEDQCFCRTAECSGVSSLIFFPLPAVSDLKLKSYFWGFLATVVPWFTNLLLPSIFGKGGHICVCVGNMSITVFFSQCRVCKQKQTFAKCYCLQTQLFLNKSIHEPRYHCTCEFWGEAVRFVPCYFCESLDSTDISVIVELES